MTITNHRAYGCSRAVERRRADALRRRPEIGRWVDVFRTLLHLIRKRKLRDRDLVLIGMPGPRAVHQTIGFIFLVTLEYVERSRVEFGVLAVRIECGHAADREHAVLMTNLRNQRAQTLEE